MGLITWSKQNILMFKTINEKKKKKSVELNNARYFGPDDLW